MGGGSVTVLLPNARLGLRRSSEGGFTPHGERLPSSWGPFLGPFPGRTEEQADGTWQVAIDPSLWPVRQNDLIIAVTGGSWLVRSSDLIQNNYDPMVDYVQTTALHRISGGQTEPGGAWFVARYTDYLDPEPPPPGPPMYEAGLWTGQGPPPPPTPGVFEPAEGDEYVDLLTGIVYELGGS